MFNLNKDIRFKDILTIFLAPNLCLFLLSPFLIELGLLGDFIGFLIYYLIMYLLIKKVLNERAIQIGELLFKKVDLETKLVILIAIGLTVSLGIALTGDLKILSDFRNNYNVIYHHKGVILLNLFKVGVTSITEELFSTFLILTFLRKRFSMSESVVINSLIFVIVHLMSISGTAPLIFIILNYFFASVIRNLLYIRYNNLLPSIITHFISNFVIFIIGLVDAVSKVLPTQTVSMLNQ